MRDYQRKLIKALSEGLQCDSFACWYHDLIQVSACHFLLRSTPPFFSAMAFLDDLKLYFPHFVKFLNNGFILVSTVMVQNIC